MIRAVLFDLDETLLDLNLEAYVWAFSSQRVRLISSIARSAPSKVAIPYWRSLVEMMGPRADNLTNAAFFERSFAQESGVPLDDPALAECVAFYDAEVFNSLSRASKSIDGKPRRGAHALLDMCQQLGLITALATNPTFPGILTRERMAWAGIEDYPFAHVSTMENSTRAKPWGRYYAEVCSAVGVVPEECLMVGNDPKNDFARDGGALRTCYVGRGRPPQAYWCGDLVRLTAFLPFLVEKG